MSTDPDSRGGFGPYLEGVGPLYVDGTEQKSIRFGKIKDLERALELHGHHVAAFLVEPIQGEAGWAMLLFSNLTCPHSLHRIIVPPKGYLSKVHALCKKHNVLLICDEIQTVSIFLLLIMLRSLAQICTVSGFGTNWKDVGISARGCASRCHPSWEGLVWRR